MADPAVATLSTGLHGPGSTTDALSHGQAPFFRQSAADNPTFGGLAHCPDDTFTSRVMDGAAASGSQAQPSGPGGSASFAAGFPDVSLESTPLGSPHGLAGFLPASLFTPALSGYPGTAASVYHSAANFVTPGSGPTPSSAVLPASTLQRATSQPTMTTRLDALPLPDSTMLQTLIAQIQAANDNTARANDIAARANARIEQQDAALKEAQLQLQLYGQALSAMQEQQDRHMAAPPTSSTLSLIHI